ncbi:uncharacterized protein LOC120215618 [Hibiscus syriacus]|uniref:uncharacterized protein LOC120215618 n=1 Tax=Hibiscus syriacus TaxID=106335 RepID=UPI00192063EC|nr:uncharacterized protein LOC120215618 [Hibiscus syriacus]
MEKKSNENFRQYAQRWRDIVVQVHPPIEEDETIVLFVNTLRAPFFTHLIENSFKSFADIVTADTRSSIQNHVRQGIREPQFDLIPMTYKELFHILYDKHVVSPYHISPVQPPYPKWYDTSLQCEYHAGAHGHSIKNCTSFKKLVQSLRNRNVINFGDNEKPNVAQNPLPNHTDFRDLVQKVMDEKEMEFFKEVSEEEEMDICTSERSPRGIYNFDYLLIVTLMIHVSEKITPKVVIIPPSPFLYKDDKQVPWKYGCKMDDIVEKDKVDESREDEHVINEPVTENEAVEFLKFLKHSEYNIVEQLHKLSARISVLALLLSSKAHQNALLKVLNQTFVPKELSVNKLDRLVANIQAINFIFFSEDEIPSGMNCIPKALHITIKCKGHILSRVLVDNGSALNVMPLVTLKKLPVDSTLMRNSQSIVRAFDGTKREVLGKIDIPLTIGPTTYEVEFLVMDIIPTYNCLLGRPWIH